jgi:DNA ligase-1
MPKCIRSISFISAWLITLGLLLSPGLTAASTAAPVMLANVYHVGMSLSDYWVSEKYDGVRGYWDGERLLTRHGVPVNAPAWFTAGWPKTPMDGELWAGREQFEVASAAVRATSADDAAWHRMRFMVFDVPGQPGPFTDRISVLNRLVAKLDVPWVQAVHQYKVADQAQLQAHLDEVVNLGGEGLALHRGSSLYRAGRTGDLVKFKPYEDAEARVVAYVPGKGKYAGVLGALLVEMPDGTRFRIGTGFSDEQRRHPPSLGSFVTYRYQGVTTGGKPRFARFMRIREAM